MQLWLLEADLFSSASRNHVLDVAGHRVASKNGCVYRGGWKYIAFASMNAFLEAAQEATIEATENWAASTEKASLC